MNSIPFRAGLAALTVLVVAGCSAEPGALGAAGNAAERNALPPVIIPVEVASPTLGNISQYFETSSRIEAESSVEVAAQGNGRCTAIRVQEGDRVSKGDILAELDQEELRAQHRQTEVQVRGQKADYERAKEALEAGLISKADYDAARFAYEQGQANLESQQIQLQNQTIRSPISGVVKARLIQVGQLISSGTPAFGILDPETFQLVIRPPEKDLSRLHVGQRAQVTVDALGARKFEAVVNRINPAVDPASGTIKVTLDFDRSVLGDLLESAFARVSLVMETQEAALLVPKDAVIEENARHYVFTVTPRTEAETLAGEGAPIGALAQEEQGLSDLPQAEYVAERIEVKVGIEDSSYAEILEGLSENEVVVTLGQYNLKDGALVRITSADAEVAKNLGLSPEEARRKADEKRGDDGGAKRKRMRDNI
jgi:membrane fusion protein, multidrug efflux system